MQIKEHIPFAIAITLPHCNEDVVRWVKLHRIESLIPVFQENGFYTLESIETLQEKDFSELKILKLGQRRSLSLALKDLKQKITSPEIKPNFPSESKNFGAPNPPKSKKNTNNSKSPTLPGPKRCGRCHLMSGTEHARKSCNVCKASKITDCPTQWTQKHPELNPSKKIVLNGTNLEKKKQIESLLEKMSKKKPEEKQSNYISSPSFANVFNSAMTNLQQTDPERYKLVNSDDEARNNFNFHLAKNWKPKSGKDEMKDEKDEFKNDDVNRKRKLDSISCTY